MRANFMWGPAAVWLLAVAQALAQLPGQGARPPGIPLARPEMPPPYVTRQSDVEIPFTVKPGDSPGKEPAAVRIFVSWDQGKTWHFYEEKKPDEGGFRFRPRQDGEFWFATQTVDRSGQTDSRQPRQPQLRLVIDTQQPQLLAQAKVARPGEVTLSWSVADASLNPTSLKIEYQDAAGNGGPWNVVSIDPAAVNSATGQMTGRAVFAPQIGGKTINLRAEVADSAGNMAYYTQRLSLSVPRTQVSDAVAAPPPDRTATRWPSQNPFAAPTGNERTMLADRSPEALQPAGESVKIPDAIENPHWRQDRLVSSSPRPVESEALPPPQAVGETLPPPARIEGTEDGSQGPGVRSQEPIGPIESNADTSAPSGEAVSAPPGSRPRLTASRRFSLDYDVESVGPEGLADVELWGTSDGGRTWMKWGSDPDKLSPFDVEVGAESVYGFKVVIVGKSGLASTAPQAGDAADIWVGVDLTRPKARLVAAAYGQGDAAGKLDIRWEAADDHLGSRPITLAISDQPDAAFTPIASGLPNSGQYFWEFDPRSPRQIYLRLEVRDEAGNVAVDQLTDPIKVEGLQPKGRIRSFNAAGPRPH
jgi:hypothetical protein